jgi:hypothetical protein
MNGRAIVSFLFALILVGVLVGVGGGIYQAGISQGIVDAGRVPAGGIVPVAGYGWGFHGFLGLLFPILFLFLIFGLLRAAFSRGRGWGPRRHGYYGHGQGWGRSMSSEFDGPDGWRAERERRIAELHQRLHDEESGKATGQGGDAGQAGSKG